MTAEEIKTILKLQPHQNEGGFFHETYRSEYSTAIYYLLTPEMFSALHRLQHDEIYHFYLGDPVELLLLYPDGKGDVITVGTDLAAGMRLQVVVPKGVWQGSRLKAGGAFALFGTTMAPGFSLDGFELGERDALVQHYPEYRDVITELCRSS